jgi:hypothetical protein
VQPCENGRYYDGRSITAYHPDDITVPGIDSLFFTCDRLSYDDEFIPFDDVAAIEPAEMAGV